MKYDELTGAFQSDNRRLMLYLVLGRHVMSLFQFSKGVAQLGMSRAIRLMNSSTIYRCDLFDLVWAS